MNKRKEIVPNNLKEYRLKAGLTQKQVAETLKVFEERISHWEKGNNVPTIENLFKLSLLYKTKIENFYKSYIPNKANVESSSKIFKVSRGV